MTEQVITGLREQFGESILATDSQYGDNVVVVAKDKLVAVAEFLRDNTELLFDSPVFVTCTDNLGSKGPRFSVSYQLRSSKLYHKIRLKVDVEENSLTCPSLTPIWRGFEWQERETYDMYGIQFEGHPDLRRIYMYDEFVGHPLRKDYPKEKRQPLVRRDRNPS